MDKCVLNEYKELSFKIKDKIRLEKSPVAIKLFLKEEDIPEGIPKIMQN